MHTHRLDKTHRQLDGGEPLRRSRADAMMEMAAPRTPRAIATIVFTVVIKVVCRYCHP